MSEEDSSKKSFLNGFKVEWSLFWHNFLSEPADEQAVWSASTAILKKLESMTDAEAAIVAKSWSQERRKLQLELEKLQYQIDESLKKLDSLRLVGGEMDATEKHIGEMSDLGLRLSKKIQWLADRLDDVREFKSARQAEAVD